MGSEEAEIEFEKKLAKAWREHYREVDELKGEEAL